MTRDQEWVSDAGERLGAAVQHKSVTSDPSSLYCLANARHLSQLERMERMSRERLCIFCPAGLARTRAADAPLVETQDWVVLRNDYPYRGTRFHALVVPRMHVTDMADLDSAVLSELGPLLQELKRLSGAAAYGLGVRNGPCGAVGGTIAHTHVHFLVPSGDVRLHMNFSA